MGFSAEWDERYRENTHLSIWPWSDMVSYVMRYARPSGIEYRVLELGCGAGANIPFFKQLGVQYYAIEGSPTIVGRLLDRFPDLENQIVVGDFTRNVPFLEEFDLVVDRASLTHNATNDIKKCLAIVYDKLKPGGVFIGIDWFSTAHSDYLSGETDEEFNTRRNIKDGPFADTGRVHFSDKAHLEELFSAYIIEMLEHKTIRREIPKDQFVSATWNLVARKRGRGIE